MQLRANGKLLLTGEYFVLDGARALAVPTRLGQTLTTTEAALDRKIQWRALNHKKEVWLEVSIDPDTPAHSQLVHGEAAGLERLLQIVAAAEKLRAGATEKLRNKKVETHLEFPSDWGLGSSSTLIWLLAQYWEIDAFQLLERTFGGSGYDLACAGASGAIEFWKDDHQKAHWREVGELPDWTEATHFVHLNQKQNSREGIRAYREKGKDVSRIAAISDITAALKDTQLLRESIDLLRRHENLVADHLQLPKVQERLFPDFPGLLKSLGAWGGDFAWILTEELSVEETAQYFKEKGYETLLSWSEMVLPS